MNKIHHIFKKNLLNKLFFLPIALLTFSPALSFAKAEKIFEENSKAVVVVEGYDFEGKPTSQGSGFIIRSDGLIITNYHVISSSSNITVKVGKEILKVEALLDIDKANDLVALKVKAINLPVVSLGVSVSKIGEEEIVSTSVSEHFKIGEKVYVISSPEGLENTISEGIISGLRNIENGRILQITAPVSPGSSGGPVFNEKGEVIGVVTFQIKDSQNLNFAIPAPVWFFLRVLPGSANEEYISLEVFREESEKNYIKSLAKVLEKTQDWSSTPKIPSGKNIEVYEEVLKLNPNHINAHIHLFNAYWREGYKEKALEHYKILKLLDPRRAEALRFLYGL